MQVFFKYRICKNGFFRRKTFFEANIVGIRCIVIENITYKKGFFNYFMKQKFLKHFKIFTKSKYDNFAFFVTLETIVGLVFIITEKLL